MTPIPVVKYGHECEMAVSSRPACPALMGYVRLTLRPDRSEKLAIVTSPRHEINVRVSVDEWGIVSSYCIGSKYRQGYRRLSFASIIKNVNH